MLSGDAEWEKKKRDMDLSSSLIEPIVESIPQFFILFLGLAFTVLNEQDEKAVERLFGAPGFISGFSALYLLLIKFVASIFSSVWGLFRVFRDGPLKLPTRFRLGVIFFGGACLMFPTTLALIDIIYTAKYPKTFRPSTMVPMAIKSFQIVALLLHSQIWTLYSLRRNLRWSVVARIIAR